MFNQINIRNSMKPFSNSTKKPQSLHRPSSSEEAKANDRTPSFNMRKIARFQHGLNNGRSIASCPPFSCSTSKKAEGVSVEAVELPFISEALDDGLEHGGGRRWNSWVRRVLSGGPENGFLEVIKEVGLEYLASGMRLK
ncbi:hypothetical protein HAX54_051606 [Datura stramonium]|uniref:Uncharacterized protein n=1 Tax=Datura stramonium TaxID=4076 RepID=A0ABS8WPV8_DATST|nr:hypothetical protein [Datura stramonium]